MSEIINERAALAAPAIRSAFTERSCGICSFAPAEFANEAKFKSKYGKLRYVYLNGEDTGSIYTMIENKAVEYKSGKALPELVALEGTGIFACGGDKATADRLLAETLGTRYTASERKTDPDKRISGKVVIVTGSAQGFGLGIAKKMAADGAYVVIADMNGEGAEKASAEINSEFGDCSIGVFANVSDEENVKSLMYKTVLTFGGLDLFVNNAGIVRAGSLDEMSLQNFGLVTSVNYTAYFLCAKYASEIMKIQNRFGCGRLYDIVQINSKSGLEGSKKNFAYAGSKFGGIGLTQSFALELVEHNIKVNSVCPGNFLDGPLWTDPVKGLFLQYLNAGKVPGAKTVADVKRYYEQKVPMDRGCLPDDVVRAIYYAVEQQYETGQAIPVTGGQVMMN